VTWTPSDMRILYLEDEAIIAMETVEVLKDLGFSNISMAYSLKMAERKLEDGVPDLALLDINVSHGRTSFSLGKDLIARGVPIVFATGYHSASLPQDMAAVIIEKPFTAQVLEKALRQAISRHDAPAPDAAPAAARI
jgi:DNA-binding NtrC family response regulator